ncbi:MAG TPA: bifunctional hydroxymethylpyrimidine kinase/phosphomethylpyrimidine kinase [Acidimicrobiales bacterium]|nr:bifunctional hydroxymethylpyrimidine kinase/phosphomethylpyrimidine kinase [Acidimicrobiales bacterium]
MSSITPPVALTIAGSDSGGGAGVQADLKTFAALGVHGTSAITAVTAQNTVGVQSVHLVPAKHVDAQIMSVVSDLRPAAVKTGMLATAATIAAVAGRADRGELPNLVVDPVMVATTGRRLLEGDAERAYVELLLPHALVAMPNLREASVLVQRDLASVDDMTAAARQLAETGARFVVIKGGHLPGPAAVDVVWDGTDARILSVPRISTANVHGTGCTLSAAVAANLALGATPADAIELAKAFLTRALRGAAGWTLGSGQGPVDALGWGEAAGRRAEGPQRAGSLEAGSLEGGVPEDGADARASFDRPG